MRSCSYLVIALAWLVVITHDSMAQVPATPLRSQISVYASPVPPASTPPASAVPATVGLQAATSLDGFLDTIEKILKIAAYVVGGLWVYFNYFKGRTHKPRMEVKVSGGSLTNPTNGLFRVLAQANNVGLSKVVITDKGSGLRVFGYDTNKAVDRWTHLATYTILTGNHKWIEPGVTIEENMLIAVEPGKYAAVRADLVLSSTDVRWKATAILS